MNVVFNDIMRDKWKQVCLETERDIAPTQGHICSESRVLVSGILFKNASHSAFPSFAEIISALPERDRVVVPHTWGTTEVQGSMVSFDGEHLSSLGFPKGGEFRVLPFSRILNTDVQDAAITTKPNHPACILNNVVPPGEFCVSGICYGQQTDMEPSSKGVGFLNWVEVQMKLHSSKGDFSSFIVKVKKDIRISFWGAPILTADGEISLIVVHQRNLSEGRIAIVGMKIRSFVVKIPCHSALCAHI